MARDHHSSLWPEAKIFLNSQRVFLWPETAQRPKVTEKLFMARDCHISLWLKVRTFLKSQRGYFWHEISTIHYGQKPQYSKRYSESIYGQGPPQFIVYHDATQRSKGLLLEDGGRREGARRLTQRPNYYVISVIKKKDNTYECE